MNLDIHGNQYKPKIIMSIILLATFSGALMQTSLGTALPTLMNDFDIDFSTAQQATTWFLLANGIMVPLSAFLATRISTRLLHVYSYGALLFGLIYCNRTIKSRWLVNISSWTYCYSNCCWFNDAIVTNHHYLYVSNKTTWYCNGSEWFSSRSRTCNGSNFCWLDIKQKPRGTRVLQFQTHGVIYFCSSNHYYSDSIYIKLLLHERCYT